MRNNSKSQVSIGAAEKSVVLGGEQLVVIAGPCVIESREHTLKAAEILKETALKLELPLVFKSSYDKANRTSLAGFRGPGLEEGLAILQEASESAGLPVLTDVHSAEQARAAAASVDMLQIPAFLCRQTDLLLAAGETMKPVLAKKGQFLAPEDMQFAVEKISSTGNTKVAVCERGTCFGYRRLVTDFPGLKVMAGFGVPLVFDATHSVQIMGGAGGASSGNRESVSLLARAAVAVGVDAVFLECHESPDKAPSDGANMLSFEALPQLLRDLKVLHELSLETR